MADSGVIYGETDTFKTTAIGHLSQYIAEVTGKSTLLFSADGGGWKPVQEEVDAGMIRPYRCDTATIPLPILRKVSQGYWPRNPEETDISMVDFVPINWNEVGGIAVEGFTSIGTMLMRHVADKNLKTGEQGTTPFWMPIRVKGELVNEVFAGNSMGHYNFVQNQLYGLTMNFISWPVKYVLFTGHEKKTEEGDRTIVMGISVPGKAITPLIPTWVGDCLHAQDYQIERTLSIDKPGGKPGEKEDLKTFERHCRYYFRKHPDPVTGLTFPAKPRVTHSAVKELDKRFPGGFFEPTPEHGFDNYLRVLDELSTVKANSLTGWRQRADEKLGRSKVAGGVK